MSRQRQGCGTLNLVRRTTSSDSSDRYIGRSVLLYRILCSLVNNYCYASKSYKKIRSARFTCERSLFSRVDGRRCNAAFIKASSYQRSCLINWWILLVLWLAFISCVVRRAHEMRRVLGTSFCSQIRCRGSQYFQVLHRLVARRGRHSI